MDKVRPSSTREERKMKCVITLMLASLATGFAYAQNPGSKLYIPPPAPNQTLTDGTKVATTTAPAFNLVLQSEIFKAKLPLQMVNDRAQADYVAEWSAIPEESHVGHSYSKELYTVAVSILDKNKQVVWAGSAEKKNLTIAPKLSLIN